MRLFSTQTRSAVARSCHGPDAYEFAKDKPFVLLSGSNFLHLLEKHGHRAKTELKEVEQILPDAPNNRGK
jgi:restriction system protein